MKPAGIVLAAGFSSRMGSPKALLEYRGKAFLQIILERLQEAGVGPLVVVLGVDARAIRGSVSLQGVESVVNPDPGRGMFSSVVLGAASIAPAPALVCLVDHPLVARTTYETLTRDGPAPQEARIATCGGKTGHPVLLGEGLVRALAANPAQPTLEHFLAACATRSHVETGDEAVVRNMNTPADLKALPDDGAD